MREENLAVTTPVTKRTARSKMILSVVKINHTPTPLDKIKSKKSIL